jgi:hypothetical protein
MAEKKPTCFVIMPITVPAHLVEAYGNDPDHFRRVLNKLIIPAVEKAGYFAIAPIAEGAVHIKAGIIKHLETDDMVLCDMSGLNPNVFFELGVRTALGKPICLVRDDKTPTVPFDTNDINHYPYPSVPSFDLVEQIEALAEHIRKSAADPKDGNALWSQYSISVKAQLAPQEGGMDAKLDYLIRRFESMDDQSRSERRSREELDAVRRELIKEFEALPVSASQHRSGWTTREDIDAVRRREELDVLQRKLAEVIEADSRSASQRGETLGRVIASL